MKDPIIPTADAIARVERECPDASPGQKHRLAQAATSLAEAGRPWDRETAEAMAMLLGTSELIQISIDGKVALDAGDHERVSALSQKMTALGEELDALDDNVGQP